MAAACAAARTSRGAAAQTHEHPGKGGRRAAWTGPSRMRPSALPAASVVAPLLQSQFAGGEGVDLVTLAGVTACLTLVASIGVGVPAARALKSIPPRSCASRPSAVPSINIRTIGKLVSNRESFHAAKEVHRSTHSPGTRGLSTDGPQAQREQRESAPRADSLEGRCGRIPDFPVTRSHPPASWPSAANSSICRTYRKTAGEESRRRSPVANRWMRP